MTVRGHLHAGSRVWHRKEGCTSYYDVLEYSFLVHSESYAARRWLDRPNLGTQCFFFRCIL